MKLTFVKGKKIKVENSCGGNGCKIEKWLDPKCNVKKAA